jgi:hypothetical protein
MECSVELSRKIVASLRPFQTRSDGLLLKVFDLSHLRN